MRRRLVVATLVLVTLPSPAWSDPPKPIDTPAPQYPKWAIGSGMSTEVELRVRVGRDGKLIEVNVVPYSVRHDLMTRELRASFDSAAVRAVRTWTFRPATRAGRAVGAWSTLRVPFSDPTDAAGPESSIVVADTSEVARFPEPLERHAPEWPAAVPYACRGRVWVRIFPGPDGRVWGANVVRSDLSCQDSRLRATVDAVVVRAALRWRYRPDDHDGKPLLVDFTLPPPRLDAPVIVGCVRDSMSGRARPESQILGLDDRPFGRADEDGWFVLRGAVTREPRLRARYDFCRAGGFRPVRPWKRPGDEVTLYTGPTSCVDDTR